MYGHPTALGVKKGLCPERLSLKIFKTSFLLCSLYMYMNMIEYVHVYVYVCVYMHICMYMNILNIYIYIYID